MFDFLDKRKAVKRRSIERSKLIDDEYWSLFIIFSDGCHKTNTHKFGHKIINM